MRNDMFENMWSPFSPEWYQQAFDKYISTADEIFNQDEIINMGFNIPDGDGSKSSVFHSNALLNNTFDEEKLRETLKDIYLNSSSKLRASNHDNVRFFQYHTCMKDVELNNSICEFSIPTESFIQSKNRDLYKLSQFYRKWIHINELFNNWEVFKFTILLFLNQRIYSDYEIRIDEQETRIRFKYEKFWWNKNYSIDIYKFETNYQKRIKATKFLFQKEWNYQIPVSYIDEGFDYDKALIVFNKINDQDIRTDGIDTVDVMGDNIEFVKIKDGIMDLSNISLFNKILIESENVMPVWMSVIIPKYFHEYPIMLPVENIYREYHPNLEAVYTNHQSINKRVKENDLSQVYIDLDDYIPNENDIWKTMIRPIVLSDAFNMDADDKYDTMDKYVSKLRKLTIDFADKIEEFRFYLKEDRNEEKFLEYCESLEKISLSVKEAYDEFRIYLRLPIDEEYENKHKEFIEKHIIDLRVDKYQSYLLSNREGSNGNIFDILSPLVYIPRKLSDRYYLAEVIKSMGDKKILWEDYDKYKNQIRFNRPIDEKDFMIFEYNIEKEVWRPIQLKVEYHFPDVYILSDPTNKSLENRIFKAFLFYSDMINIRKESVDIVKPTPDYDKDIHEYEYNKEGIFRNIFMEKFYWNAIKSIYSGSMRTKSKWEVIEYVINNPTYRRFNNLFINTMDPYFKLGMANYLKNDNFLFSFDYLISKMNENINQMIMGYTKVTNYQMYLNKTWKPSYFDYILNIKDDWEYKDRLIKRPPVSFDIYRLLKILREIESNVNTNSTRINMNLDYVLNKLELESYNLDENMYEINIQEFNEYTGLNIDNFNNIDIINEELKKKEIFPDLFEYEDDKLFINSTIGLKNLKFLLQKIIKFNSELNEQILEFDLDIYSIEDTEKILRYIMWYSDAMQNFKRIMKIVFDDSTKKNQYENKRKLLSDIRIYSIDKIEFYMNKLCVLINNFDMENFMKVTNNLDTLKNSGKINENDISLIGEINKFDQTQSDDNIKEIRNKVFISTTQLNSIFKADKSYSIKEIFEFEYKVNEVKDNLHQLRIELNIYWKKYNKDEDKNIINKLDNSEFLINQLYEFTKDYMDVYRKMLNDFNNIHKMIKEITDLSISDTERNFVSDINEIFESIRASLSYIAGINKYDEAKSNLQLFLSKLKDWFDFIDIEEIVFTKILDSTKLPSEFTDLILVYSNLIDEILNCLKHLNDFTPDKEAPTYIDIYESGEYEVVNKGFRHKIGNIAYVPNLSAYKIMKINNDIQSAKEVVELNYRKTTFRNPLVQEYPYFSITNGQGMDLRVKPKTVKTTKIINDEPLEKFISLSKGIINLIRNSLPILNYNDNINLSNVLDKLDKLNTDWTELKSFYWDYMSDKKDQITSLINLMNKLKEPVEDYIESRFNINIDKLLFDLDKFIITSYKYHRDRNLLNGNYFFYDDQVRISYNNLYHFFNNSDNWKNISGLVNLINDIKIKVDKFNKNILSNINNEELNTLYNSFILEIDKVLENIKSISEKRKHLRAMLYSNESFIKKIPDKYYKDIWYKIKESYVSNGGSGYNIGDILEIVQELPLDSKGEPIRDQEDLILNDIIFYQVTRVDDNGSVLSVKPFMNYALPYKIYGNRETSTRIGIGEKCILNIKTEEVDINKSYLFYDKDTKVYIDKFNDMDLFKFKFNNQYDLDIQYEVFFSGIQTTDYIFRHLKDEDDDKHPTNHLLPSWYDAIYVRANEIMKLQNSTFNIKRDHYFRYRIDEVSIIDPGAGYYEGQEIYIDTGINVIKLKVNELDGTPLKGIKSIDLNSNNVIFDKVDPSTDNGVVIIDDINNIDDEYNDNAYDLIPNEGIKKPLTRTYSVDRYSFISKRYDKLKPGRNNYFMSYFDILNKNNMNGDPDGNWYLGSRLDNSQIPYEDKRKWNGIMNIISPTDPFIPDLNRTPYSLPLNGEYQSIKRLRFHDSSNNIIDADLKVKKNSELPKHFNEWPQAQISKTVIVEHDEKYDNHRMIYKIRSLISSGYFIYDEPEMVDFKWNIFKVDWTDSNYYPDYPSLNTQYKSEEWRKQKTFSNIQRMIKDKRMEKVVNPKQYKMTYIHDIGREDISVYNHTLQQWENLNDYSRWKFKSYYNKKNKKYGFELILTKEDIYSYDLELFLNKISSNQIRNSKLKKNAIIKVKAVLHDEIDIKGNKISIDTGRHLRIRKLFPYEQIETHKLGNKYGNKINIKLNNYMHFKNELHLEDVKLYNKSAKRYEDIFDNKLFEIRFKNDKYNSISKETNTKIVRSLISNPGDNFFDGNVWAWNSENNIHLFGEILTNKKNGGNIIRFIPTHCPNPPTKDMILEFYIYQHNNQTEKDIGKVLVEFNTNTSEVWGDGYIHNVSNRLAPLPKEFQIVCKYEIDEGEYEINISKSPKEWSFIEPKWKMSPTFHIDKQNISFDRLYATISGKGRFPLINPSTLKPTLNIKEISTGTDVTFLNLYKKYEKFEIHAMPYPMRSVYTLRRIPKHGYINLKGKINKPLDRRYFEFWVNGRLLDNEVTIITPTKLFLHGLKSLRNLEIIEINRDSNEYFSDNFLNKSNTKLEPEWNLTTYLDDALEGNLKGDNYRESEQEVLLSPVWKQVEINHPEYKNYPPNMDIEPDILQRISKDDLPIEELSSPAFEYLITDIPTIQGQQIGSLSLTFEDLGLVPFTEEDLIKLLNEEWKEEIDKGLINPHTNISDDAWYGMVVKMFDENGNQVKDINLAAYKIFDSNIIKINSDTKISKIIKNNIVYNLD